MSAASLRDAACAPVSDVLAALGTSPEGLSGAEARLRAASAGANVIPAARARALRVLISQLANPLLILLAATAVISLVLGESTDAIIILVIVTMSVGLGFFNE